jgi:hypothetical protein
MTGNNDLPRRGDPTEINPRPRPTAADTPAPNVAHLRRDIEAGATGDKLPMLDPAASPLGTDDEAGGAPPTAAMVAAAREAERGPHSASKGVGGRTGPRFSRIAALLLLAVLLASAALWLSFGSPR